MGKSGSIYGSPPVSFSHMYGSAGQSVFEAAGY